jgi:hypothetical protein
MPGTDIRVAKGTAHLHRICRESRGHADVRMELRPGNGDHICG